MECLVSTPLGRAELTAAAFAACLVIIVLMAVTISALRAWAYPWTGLGEDVESFEDLCSVLRLVSAPIAAVIVAGALAWCFWPPHQKATKDDPCTGCVGATKPVEKPCRYALQDCASGAAAANLATAIGALTQAIRDLPPQHTVEPGNTELLTRLGAIDSTLHDVLARLPTGDAREVVAELHELTAAVGAVQRAIREAPPPASGEMITKAVDAAATRLAASPPWPDLIERLRGLERALRELVDKPGSSQLNALPGLLATLGSLDKTLRETTATSSDTIKQAIGDGVAKLAQQLDAISTALRTTPRLRPTDRGSQELPNFNELTAAIKDIAVGLRESVPGISPPILAKLDAILTTLTTMEDRLQALDGEAALTPVLEHLSLIEVLISEIDHPAARTCQKVNPLQEPQPNLSVAEERLIAAARRGGLTWARSYRVMQRQLFYDPGSTAPSPIGQRIIGLIVEDARRHGWALVIRAEADAASDGEAADMMAARRARELADAIEKRGSVPVLGFGIARPSGAVSEPYRRVVRIDVLEPCQ